MSAFPQADTDEANPHGTWTGRRTITPASYGQAGTPLMLTTSEAPEPCASGYGEHPPGSPDSDYAGPFAGRPLILPNYTDPVCRLERILVYQHVNCGIQFNHYNRGAPPYYACEFDLDVSNSQTTSVSGQLLNVAAVRLIEPTIEAWDIAVIVATGLRDYFNLAEVRQAAIDNHAQWDPVVGRVKAVSCSAIGQKVTIKQYQDAVGNWITYEETPESYPASTVSGTITYSGTTHDVVNNVSPSDIYTLSGTNFVFDSSTGDASGYVKLVSPPRCVHPDLTSADDEILWATCQAGIIASDISVT